VEYLQRNTPNVLRGIRFRRGEQCVLVVCRDKDFAVMYKTSREEIKAAFVGTTGECPRLDFVGRDSLKI
jgi:hypothetical protein